MMILLWSTNSASGQTTSDATPIDELEATGKPCPPPRVCATKKLLEDTVDRRAENLCAKARIAAGKIDQYRLAAASAEQRESNCWGRLAQKEESPPPQKWQAPTWLKIGLDVAIGGFAFGSGFAFADDAPDGVKWSILTAGVGVLVSRFVVEIFEANND